MNRFAGGAVLSLLVLAFAGCSSDIDDSDSGASTAEDYIYDESTSTYTVYTADGLLAWNKAAQDTLSLNITLEADIDLTDIDYEWLPVGNASAPYTGTFDGGGYAITGLTVNQGSAECVGLLGRIGSKGKVQNLTLDDASIIGGAHVGAVAGWNEGAVTSCSASGNVSGSGNNVGGVAGNNNYGGAVTDCAASVSVSGNYYVGGVAGYNYSGAVTACSASGNVSGYFDVGGVAGHNSGNIAACYWSDYDGDGIGDDSGTSSATKVDGSSTTWEDAVDAMNDAISEWNTANSGKQCEWEYELASSLPTLTKSGS